MMASKEQLWERFQKYYREYPSLGLSLDISRVNFPDDFFTKMEKPFARVFNAMQELEKGAIANPDEKRMVGHYWLRNSALAPTAELRQAIDGTLTQIKQFTADVHSGKIQGTGGAFKNLLVIGIGGSALGPQFVAHALGDPTRDKMKVFFFDNTDPDGMDLVLSKIGKNLGQTLAVVISKSGGTKETRNGMLEAQRAYAEAGLDFGKHTVAVTGANSELDKFAVKNNWIARFPMWDWVGGRTSETSAVGLLPAALQGIDIESFLKGAAASDEATRSANVTENPSAAISALIYLIGNGKGEKDMVVLPYKDRLELFSRYLQQLVMESLGKELDLEGRIVNQGVAVYGNKGSTDQHAYVQQLREGVLNFFAIFIEVLKDRGARSMEVEPNVTSGDYLQGFYLGTREALYEKGRESITLTVKEVSPFTVGVLIALFERIVGFYASLIEINAYHQPGVEAGKKAAGAVITLQLKIQDFLGRNKGKAFTVGQISKEIGSADQETIFKVCEHLVANADRGFKKTAGKTPFESSYQMA